jgi:hypothetical protein
MFVSYDDKFRSIVRRNAVNKVRREQFEQWWKDECADEEAIGDYEDIKKLAFSAYEAGIWAGSEEEFDTSGKFEEAVQKEFDRQWAEAIAANKKP